VNLTLTRTRILTAVAVSALLTSAACGGGGDDEKAASSTTTTSETTTTTTAAEGTAPLTGAPADPALTTRPALVVKIDNAPKARPQAGINEADIIVEEGVEGGVTRFAALFHSQNAASVGPVRSARSTDISFALQLGKPLFAYSGANAVFAKLLRESPLVDVGVGQLSGAYQRQAGRPAPYNLFSSTPPLFAKASGQAVPPPLFAYRPAGEAAPAAAESARRTEALWKDKVETRVVFEWDPAVKGFARTQNGTPHVDAANRRVAPENVLFQVVTYRNTGLVDRSGTAVPEAELIGEGEALLLTDGKAIKGRWARTSDEALTTYTDESGAPMRLTPGRTWLELVPKGNLSSPEV
jgi:hypothetical protein